MTAVSVPSTSPPGVRGRLVPDQDSFAAVVAAAPHTLVLAVQSGQQTRTYHFPNTWAGTRRLSRRAMRALERSHVLVLIATGDEWIRAYEVLRRLPLRLALLNPYSTRVDRSGGLAEQAHGTLERLIDAQGTLDPADWLSGEEAQFLVEEVRDVTKRAFSPPWAFTTLAAGVGMCLWWLLWKQHRVRSLPASS